MKLFGGRKKQARAEGYDPVAAYQRHLNSKFVLYGEDRDLAFADAVGSISVDLFREQGDAHASVLRHHGLRSGMTVYDLGCGCGRTAQALYRSDWEGRYFGADIIPQFIEELKAKCPGYEAYVHRKPSIVAADGSIDMVFHWSVFTHLPPEECYLYMEDSFRALKPGGKLVFSFLDLGDPEHVALFRSRVGSIRRSEPLNLLDTFLHPEWIDRWAIEIGFENVRFTSGQDGSAHPPFWQSLVAMNKPA